MNASASVSMTLTQQQLQLQRELIESFDDKVDTSVTKLYDAYGIILNHCQVEKSLGGHEHPLLLAAASNIVYNCQSLLDQIQELRMCRIIQQQEGVEESVESQKLEEEIRQQHREKLDSAMEI